MEHLAQIVAAIFASTGFWACVQMVLQERMKKKSAERQALLGLLHNELVDKAEFYLKRGYLSEGEFRDLEEYVYNPYKNLGGNGTGEAYMEQVRTLIFKKKGRKDETGNN